MPTLREIQFEVLAWLCVAAVSAVVVAALALLPPGLRRPLLPPPRRRAVPWNGAHLLALVFLLLLWPGFVHEVMVRFDFMSRVYGPEHPPDKAREQLWQSVFVVPVQLAAVPLVLWLAAGTRLYQLGLTTHRLRENVALGCVGLIAFAPFVLLLHVVVTVCYSLGTGTRPEDHALTRLAREQPLAVEWLLIVGTAVVAAPVWEELLFRGVLQTWFAARPWGGSAAGAAALALAFLERWPKASEKWVEHGFAGSLSELAPAVFVIAVLPGLVFLQRASARAVYGTALLFGAAHSTVWPTPVALFALGLGLGYLAHRTQSLVGPMVLHSLFNSVACVLLVVTHGDTEPGKGNATTSPARRPSTASTSTTVPGSWLPRRT